MPMASTGNKEDYRRPVLRWWMQDDEDLKQVRGILFLLFAPTVLPLRVRFSLRNPPIIGEPPHSFTQHAISSSFLRRNHAHTSYYNIHGSISRLF